MSNLIMRVLFAMFLSILTLSSCKYSKEKLGLTTSGPNEYQIERGKQLEVPPHFGLVKASTSKD